MHKDAGTICIFCRKFSLCFPVSISHCYCLENEWSSIKNMKKIQNACLALLFQKTGIRPLPGRFSSQKTSVKNLAKAVFKCLLPSFSEEFS